MGYKTGHPADSFGERNPGDAFTNAGLGVRGGWMGVGSTALEGPGSRWGDKAHNPEGQHKSSADPRLVGHDTQGGV